MTEPTTRGISKGDSIDTAESPKTRDRHRLLPGLRLDRPRQTSTANPTFTIHCRSPTKWLGEMFDPEARLSWVLAWLAGLVGAVAFTHSADYFVTAMSGNTQRAVVGVFIDRPWLTISASSLLACFFAGAVTGALGRQYLWGARKHGPVMLMTLCLIVATVVDVGLEGWLMDKVYFGAILVVAFGMGVLNTSFVKNGEVSIGLGYFTGTIVKLAQGLVAHLSGGGTAADWLGYFVLYMSFVVGGMLGGSLNLLVTPSQIMGAATIMCALTTIYTYFYARRHGLSK